MSVAVMMEFPGISEDEYAALLVRCGFDQSPPPGLLFHMAGPGQQGWRVVDVWESEKAGAHFREGMELAFREERRELPVITSWPLLKFSIPSAPPHNAYNATAAAFHGSISSIRGTEEELQEKPPVYPPDWLDENLLEALYQAGLQALPGRDVPAAAAVVYKGTIITGWNDVLTAGNAGGHADINAITNAIRHFGGPEKFKQLDREKLYLVTTYEPCPMCEGAIAVEHKIKPENVFVLMLKEPWYRQEERDLTTAFRKGWQYVACDELQQRLFCKHPFYRKAFPNKCRDL